MPIASRTQIDGFKSALPILFERIEAITERPEFTHDEVLELTSPVEDHQLLKTAASVAAVYAANSTMRFAVPGTFDGVTKPQIELSMCTYEGNDPPLSPRRPEWQKNVRPETRDKIEAWLVSRLEVGRKFGLLRHVVSEFCEARNGWTGRAVRYVFPAILLIARNSHSGYRDRCDEWATKYNEFASTSHPKMSLAFRQAVRDASTLVTSASMLDDTHVEAARNMKRQVNIALYGSNEFDFDGVKIDRM